MKLAVISDEVSQDLDVAIRTAVVHGHSGLEIRSVGGKGPMELNAAELAGIRRRLDDAGLEVVCFDSPAFKSAIPTSAADLLAAVDEFSRALECAAALGAPMMRIFSFYRDGPPEPRKAAEVIGPILRQYADVDLKLAVETGMRTNTPDGATMLEFLTEGVPESVGVVWDPGNSVFAGFGDDVFPADYERLKDRIVLVHVKDPSDEGEYVKLGDGLVPWIPIIDRLVRDGYDGYLSLETHWRLEGALNQDQRDTPWGYSFSAGGVEASSICMSILADWTR